VQLLGGKKIDSPPRGEHMFAECGWRGPGVVGKHMGSICRSVAIDLAAQGDVSDDANELFGKRAFAG
jgi:hypothetical protein